MHLDRLIREITHIWIQCYSCCRSNVNHISGRQYKEVYQVRKWMRYPVHARQQKLKSLEAKPLSAVRKSGRLYRSKIFINARLKNQIALPARATVVWHTASATVTRTKDEMSMRHGLRFFRKGQSPVSIVLR